MVSRTFRIIKAKGQSPEVFHRPVEKELEVTAQKLGHQAL